MACRRPDSGATLVDCLVITGLLIVVAALCLPGFLTAQRGHNERQAGAALYSMTTAEADFRSNDRDWNGVQDFWTGDVAGLYFVAPGGEPIRLIDRGVAGADSNPLHPGRSRGGPRGGYRFSALDRDDSVPGGEAYRRDTDGISGNVHHLSKFGFCAHPAWPGRTGKVTMIINEGNSIFGCRGLKEPPSSWPCDHDLKLGWSHWG